MLSSTPPPDKPKLLDLVRGVLGLKHYSIRTEECYVDWVRQRKPRGPGVFNPAAATSR